MATVVSKHCTGCGELVAEGARFCGACGAPSGVSVAVTPAAATRAGTLQTEIDRYVRRGYRVVSQTDTTAQVFKPKGKPNWLILGALVAVAFLGGGNALLVCGGLFFLYGLWWMFQGDKQAYIAVDADGRVTRR